MHYRDIQHEPQGSTLSEDSVGASAFSAVTVDDGEEEVSTLAQRGGAFTRLGTRGAAPRLPYGMNGHVVSGGQARVECGCSHKLLYPCCSALKHAGALKHPTDTS